MTWLIPAACLTLACKFQEQAIKLPSGEPATFHTAPVQPGVDLRKLDLLRAAFAKIDSPLAVDLFDNPQAFDELGALPDDVNCLARLSKANARRLGFAEGAYVVYRDGIGQAGFIGGQTDQQVYGWLDRLMSQNPDQFRALLTGGADLSDLDDEGQALFGGAFAGIGGANRGLVSGTPVNVSIALFPRLYRNGSDVSDKATSYALTSAARLGHSRKLSKELEDVSPFRPTFDGDLDFGPGRLLTLLDLCTQAGTKFGFGFQCDTRSRSDLIFVKGRYTKERIQAALKLIGTGGPTVVLKDSMSAAELRALIRKVLRGALDLSDPADPTSSYLKSLLDNPKAIDPNALAKFGFTADQAGAATYVSLCAGISFQSNVGRSVNRNGAQVSIPVTYTMGLGGS